MPATSPEIRAQQLADTEEAIVTLRSPQRIEEYLSRKYSITTRAVRNWCRIVRARWREQAVLVDRSARRDDMRQTLATLMRVALSRTEPAVDPEGKAIYAVHNDGSKKLDKEGFPIMKMRAKPDIRAAMGCAKQLRALDALDEPFTAKLVIDAELNAMPDLKKLDAVSFEKLRELLTAVSPDKDLRRLAGDLFKGASFEPSAQTN